MNLRKWEMLGPAGPKSGVLGTFGSTPYTYEDVIDELKLILADYRKLMMLVPQFEKHVVAFETVTYLTEHPKGTMHADRFEKAQTAVKAAFPLQGRYEKEESRLHRALERSWRET